MTLCGIGENRPGNLGKPLPMSKFASPMMARSSFAGDVTPGYFKNPEATREAWTRRLVSHGDLGALDPEAPLESSGARKIFSIVPRIEHLSPVYRAAIGDQSFIRQAGWSVTGGRLSPCSSFRTAKNSAALARDESTLSYADIELRCGLKSRGERPA